MRHLSEGALRRMLDDPSSLKGAGQAHLQDCGRCRKTAAAVVGDAHLVAILLESGPRPEVEVRPALDRLRAGGLGPLAAPVRNHRSTPSLRRGRRPLVAALLVVFLGLALVGTGVAGNLIKIFEPEEIVAVPVDLDSLSSLPALGSFGRFESLHEPEESKVETLEEAAAATGLQLLRPQSTPEGPERITVLSAGRVSFTFDAPRAEAATGEDLPAALVELDGSSLFLDAGPAVLQVFGTPAESLRSSGSGGDSAAGVLSRLPDLAIVQMATPVLTSSGPTVEEYRQALLQLPGLPPELVAQVEALGDLSATLPVPIPVGLAESREVEVGGVTGLAVGDNTGVGSGVVWQDGGVIRAVAGPMTQDEALAIARSMR